MMKNGVHFIVLVFLVAKLFKIFINQIRGQNNLSAGKILNICLQAKIIASVCRVEICCRVMCWRKYILL